MSTLGRWLVGILNAHIERHNMPAAEPVHVTSTSEPGGHVFEVYPSAKPMLDEIAGLSWEPTGRPCWACGDPVGFHAFHLPCWKVAPFRLKSGGPPAALRPDFVDGVRILWDLEPGATT